MFALIRLVAMALVVLTVVYISVSLYSRAVRKTKLEAEWEETQVGDRDSFVREGLEAYSTSFRRKLILGVYILPSLLLIAIIYATNSH